VDFALIGRVPAQVRVLHRVLGLGGRAEQAVGHREQALPVPLEVRHPADSRRALTLS